MKIRKILIYGSSYLTQKTCELLQNYYNLVGAIPALNPTISGEINLPLVDDTIEHDIKLSIQYDKKIIGIHNAYNVHTGLLPSWGGTDILYHTLKDKDESYLFEQGLTFHKMSDKFDYGNIISKQTYSVNDSDTMISLYSRMLSCYPSFVLGGVRLLESMTKKEISECYREKPRIFKRGDIDESDTTLYNTTLVELRNKFIK